ncbi:hypothetical protein MYX84_00870 [Acidobacteria bacterium AH-259-O06]|nr:hypothetical protein [Acidobacteria bacterium AH-259-O06]
MNRTQYASLLVLAMVCGLVGGAISTWLLMAQSVLAQASPQKVIEAEEFRVVGEDGTMLWRVGATPQGHAAMNLFNKQGSSSILLAWDTDNTPFIRFLGPDARLDLGLNWYISGEITPGLNLYDTDGNLRATFAVSARGDPFLLFLDPDGGVVLDLEMTDRVFDVTASGDVKETDKKGVSLSLNALSQSGVISRVSLDHNGLDIHAFKGRTGRLHLTGSSIDLGEDILKSRAVIGSLELKNNRTGSTEIRPLSSLVLFDEKGKVVWSAP